MGNVITNQKVNADFLRMSNSATSAFASVLALNACDAAQSAWEKRFAQWVVDLDQSYRGVGMASFDISEIGWNTENFEQQKQHVLKVIDLALNQHRWSALYYVPVIKDQLQQFRDMVALFQPQHIDLSQLWSLDDESITIALCPKHEVYLNPAGCILCNNEPINIS